MPEYRPDHKGEIRNRDFFGGDFKGVLEKLDYLKGLGVDTLYFNPKMCIRDRLLAQSLLGEIVLLS